MKLLKLFVVFLFLIFNVSTFSLIYNDNEVSKFVKTMWQLFDYKEYDRIFSEGNKILEISKNNSDISEIYTIFGFVYLRQNKYDLAEKEVKKALSYNPNSKSAQTVISFIYSETNRMDESIKILEKLVANYPEDVKLLWKLGEGYVLNRQFDKSIYCYEKILRENENILKNDSNIKIIFRNMIYIYTIKNDSENAYKYMDKLLEYFPNDYEALLLSAKLLINFGENEKAIEKLNIIMDNFYPEKEDYFVMGVAYFQLKAYNKAKYYFSEALKLDENYSEALEYMKYLNKAQ